MKTLSLPETHSPTYAATSQSDTREPCELGAHQGRNLGLLKLDSLDHLIPRKETNLGGLPEN